MEEQKKNQEELNNFETENLAQENNSQETENQKTEEKKGFFGKNKDKEKIKELENEVNELKADYLRSRADFENYRRRMQKELEEARERAITSFVLDILPSVDNFEMSLKMTDNKEMFIKGVQMIHQNLLNTLKENHYEQFSPRIGEEFDPIKHEPILIETTEIEPGKILNILQIGYKKQDKIIRPARVQIAKLPQEETENLEN